MNIPRTIYAIRHNPTGKVYVGSSSMLDLRLRYHMNALKAQKHANEAMQADYNTYGGDYTFFKLAEITRFQDRGQEYAWMEILQTRDPAKGYNYKECSKHFSLDSCEQVQIAPHWPKRRTP